VQHVYVTKSFYKASSEANCCRTTVEWRAFFHLKSFLRCSWDPISCLCFDPFKLEALCNSSYHVAPLCREFFKLSPSEGWIFIEFPQLHILFIRSYSWYIYQRINNFILHCKHTQFHLEHQLCINTIAENTLINVVQ
jgi:hypothetical protein